MYKFKLFPQFGRLIRCAVLGAKKARGFDPSKQQLPELQTEVPTLSLRFFNATIATTAVQTSASSDGVHPKRRDFGGGRRGNSRSLHVLRPSDPDLPLDPGGEPSAMAGGRGRGEGGSQAPGRPDAAATGGSRPPPGAEGGSRGEAAQAGPVDDVAARGGDRRDAHRPRRPAKGARGGAENSRQLLPDRGALFEGGEGRQPRR